MLLEEFDADKYERTIKKEGIEIGEERAFALAHKLMEQKRTEDLTRLTKEPAYREQLFREFGL